MQIQQFRTELRQIQPAFMPSAASRAINDVLFELFKWEEFVDSGLLWSVRTSVGKTDDTIPVTETPGQYENLSLVFSLQDYSYEDITAILNFLDELYKNEGGDELVIKRCSSFSSTSVNQNQFA